MNTTMSLRTGDTVVKEELEDHGWEELGPSSFEEVSVTLFKKDNTYLMLSVETGKIVHMIGGC